MRLCWVVLCLLQWVWCSGAYHVLAVFSVPSRSHNTLGKGIVDALLQAGHEVTWATPYPPKGTVAGLKIIDVSSTTAIADDLDFADPKNSGLIFFRRYSWNITRTTLNTPALRDVIVSQEFDAVVTEPFFTGSDCGYAALLQIPWIAFMSIQIQPYLEEQVDEVRSVTTVPMLLNLAPMPMGFWRRFLNTIIFTVMKVERWLDYPTLKSFYESQYGPLAAARGVTLPPFNDAFYNMSLLLTNSHPSLTPAKSLPPNVVEIGGFHINDSTPPLPKDLQKLLDSSPQGVVYFSMGSVLKSSKFPAVTKKHLVQVFSELPYTVLWKFEEQLEGRPENVHTRSWMPQDSILSHPHTKLFITHGGLLSMMEAVHHGVPLLMVPVYGDQGNNAFDAVQLGIARTVAYGETMAWSLKTELAEMLRNDSYTKRVKYLSTLFRRRPVAPSKLIAHYIEVAIESKGAYHLRSKSLLYWWYQRWMLDQLAVLLVILALLYMVGKNAPRTCLNKIWSTTTVKKNKLKNS